jgi:hypothetical protein
MLGKCFWRRIFHRHDRVASTGLNNDTNLLCGMYAYFALGHLLAWRTHDRLFRCERVEASEKKRAPFFCNKFASHERLPPDICSHDPSERTKKVYSDVVNYPNEDVKALINILCCACNLITGENVVQFIKVRYGAGTNSNIAPFFEFDFIMRREARCR